MLNKIQHQFKRKADILMREGQNLVFKSPLLIQSKNGSADSIDIVKTANASCLAADTRSAFYGQIKRDATGEVDLVAEMSRHPDALWIRVKAIEADAPNDNGDYFSREEIIKSYKSFEGVPVFTNHENGKVENAKGKVVKADWDDREGAVYCTMYIDRKANGPLCRAIEEGYVTDVSMGTQVDYSTCSICEKKALDASAYCDHVKTMKGRAIEGKKVFEKNYGLKFIEISVVTDGACPDCTIREIIDPNDFLHRVAAAVSTVNNARAIKTSQMIKDGGQAEIQKLNQAMDLLEDVTQTMLGQRQFIDLEFASKVMEVLADLQHVNDELVDQGYGRIGDTGTMQQQQMGVPPLPENSGGTMQEQPMAGQKPSITGPSGVGVGTVTEPATASSSGGKNILTADAKLQALREKITQIYDEAKSRSGGVSVDTEKVAKTAAKLAKIWENPSIKKFQTEISEGDFTVVIGNEDIWGVRGGEKVASLKIASLDPEVREKLQADPKNFAENALEAFKTKFASSAKMEKEAGYAPTDTKEQHGQTMEAQLRSQKLPLHPRTNDVRESITEDQLRSKQEGYDFHAVQDKSRDSITEAQLQGGDVQGYEYHKVQNDPRDETMDAQLRNEKWKGNSNPAGKDGEHAAGVSDQAQQITEGQLNDFKDAAKHTTPTDAITEKQLTENSENWGRRIASKDDAIKAKSAAFKAIAKTALATGATPEEILSLIEDFSATPKNSIAAERAVETLASHKPTREAALRRAKFHGVAKIASTPEIANYLLGSMSDAGMVGMVARETLEAIREQKNAGKKIEEAIAAEKTEAKPAKAASAKDFLREALADAGEQINVVLPKSAVKVSSEDSEKFAEAAYELAVKEAAKSGYKVTEKIHLAEKNGNIEVAMIGVKADPVVEAAKVEPAATEKTATAEELEARKQARKEVVAQMGGGMPGGDMAGGAGGGMPGPGGGTTMPAAPGAGADPTAGVPPVAGLGTPTDGPAMDDESTGEALPPGSICPVCGAEDVEVRHGEFTCNNCGAGGDIEVVIKVTEWPGVVEDTEPKAEEGIGGEDAGGLGDMGGGAGMELPGVGMQQAFKLTPEMIKKAGSKPLGSFCPHCGSSKTKIAMKKGCGECECGHCGGQFEVESMVDTVNHTLAGRITWTDKNVAKVASAKMAQIKLANKAANELKARKASLDSALRKEGLVPKFAKADLAGKAAIIAELADKKLLVK